MKKATPNLAVATPTRDSAKRSALHLLNVPNFLTLCRILSIPFFLVLLSKQRFTDALYVFIAAALTDSLDGTVARWFDHKTELGAFLDPFADKLLLVSSFVVLTVEQVFPGWLLIVVVVRDVIIVFGYFMLAFFTGDRIPVRPSYAGKAATFLQLACVVAALFNLAAAPAGTNLALAWRGLLYVTVITTGFSGLQYMYRGLIILSSKVPQMFR